MTAHKEERGRRDLLRRPEIVKRILDALVNGNTVRNACLLAGISEAVFYQWKQKAEIAEQKLSSGNPLTAKEKRLLDFFESVKAAEAEAIDRNVKFITIAARDSWQAAAWYLERRRPEDFALRNRTEVSAGPGTTIEVKVQGIDPKQLSDEDLRAIAKLREKLPESS